MTEFTIKLPKLVYFRVNMEANSFSLCDHQENKWILALLMNGEMTTAKQAALAQRMTACWSACAGIGTEEHVCIASQEEGVRARLKAVVSVP